MSAIWKILQNLCRNAIIFALHECGSTLHGLKHFWLIVYYIVVTIKHYFLKSFYL